MRLLTLVSKYKLPLLLLLTFTTLFLFDLLAWNAFQQSYSYELNTPPLIEPIEDSAQIKYTILEQSPSKIRFRIDAPSNSKILLHLPLSANWKAFIDRKPINISRSDLERTSLIVPKGHSEIELSYRFTPIQKLGFAIVDFGLIILFLYLFSVWIKQIKWKGELSLTALSLILSILVAEIIFRKIAHYPFAENCFKLDPTYHHLLIPNKTCIFSSRSNSFANVSNSINTLALRDHEIESPKPVDEFRLLMLGDSFTAAMNVESKDTFSKQLEKILFDQIPQNNYKVINAGVPSYSPLLEYLYLKDKGLKLEPDLIILNLDISDIADEARYYQQATIDADGNLISVSEIPGTLPLHKKINYLLKQNLVVYERLIFPKILNAYSSIFNKNAAKRTENYGNFEADYMAITRDDFSHNQEIIWHWPFKSIRLIRALCQQYDIPFVLGLYPYPQQVNGREWQTRKSMGFDLDRTYSTRYFDALESFAQKENIPLINSLDAFRQSKKSPLFFPLDTHFTPEGHRVYAQEIFNHLKDHSSEYGITD